MDRDGGLCRGGGGDIHIDLPVPQTGGGGMRGGEKVDRLSPLTPEERESAERYAEQIDRFLCRFRLDPAEWYDVAAIGYLQTIQYIYRRRPDIPTPGPLPIAILYYGMRDAVGKEKRRQHDEKHGGGTVTMSLDERCLNGDGSLLEELIPGREDVEKTVLDRDLIDRCLETASPRQRDILMYTIAGLSQNEIGEAIGSSRAALSMQLSTLRQKLRVERDGMTPEYREVLKRNYERNRRYHETHREQDREYNRQYRKNHPREIRGDSQNNRKPANKKSTPNAKKFE